ncbi:MAG: hypothetical protein KKD44_25885, partial [Proteobacteria bacterium]|nr:hypothetical protein [Pseudomonadota bacterium]
DWWLAEQQRIADLVTSLPPAPPRMPIAPPISPEAEDIWEGIEGIEGFGGLFGMFSKQGIIGKAIANLIKTISELDFAGVIKGFGELMETVGRIKDEFVKEWDEHVRTPILNWIDSLNISIDGLLFPLGQYLASIALMATAVATTIAAVVDVYLTLIKVLLKGAAGELLIMFGKLFGNQQMIDDGLAKIEEGAQMWRDAEERYKGWSPLPQDTPLVPERGAPTPSLGPFGIPGVPFKTTAYYKEQETSRGPVPPPGVAGGGIWEGISLMPTLDLGPIQDFIDSVIKLFKDLKKILVGASIIPDIVNGIVKWFGKLPGLLAQKMVGVVSSVVDPWGIVQRLPDVVVAAKVAGNVLFESVSDTINEKWTAFKEIATDVTKNVYEKGSTVFKDVVDKASVAWSGFKELATDVIKNAKETGSDAFKRVVDFASTAWTTFRDLLTDVTKNAKETGAGAFRTIVDFASTAWTTFRDLVWTVGKTVTEIGSGVFTTAVDTASTAWRTFRDLVGTVYKLAVANGTDFFNTLVTTARDKWNEFTWLISEVAKNIKVTGQETFYDTLIWARDTFIWFRDGVISAVSKLIQITGQTPFLDALTWARDTLIWFRDNTLASVFKTIGITDSFTSTYKSIKALWDDVLGWLNKQLTITLTWFSVGQPTSQEMATGGLVLRRTIATVAEAGPELIVPLNKVWMMFESAFAGLNAANMGALAIPGGSGIIGGTYTFAPVIHFTGVASPARVQRAVAEAGIDWVREIRR